MKFLVIAGFGESLLGFRAPLLAALQAAGFDVHVVAPGLSSGSIRESLERKGLFVHSVPIERTGLNPISDAIVLVRLIQLMRRLRPEYVLAYTVKPVIYGSIAARLARIPHSFALITGLGHSFQDESGRSTILTTIVTKLYTVALARISKVFFQNPDDELLFRRRAILRRRTPSCVVNGSGVDISDFPETPLPSEGLRFLLVARLLASKGIRVYAEAARRVRQRAPWVRFALVGWLDDSPDSIRAEELSAWVEDGTIEFLGRLNDVRPAIATCSVFVLPSYYREGTPRTVLEAMAMGRPIITTDAPGCRETVREGENGFLVPVRCVEALEGAMLKFVQSPILAERMGSRSRQLASEKYDVRKVNSMMLSEMGVNQSSFG